MAMDRSTDRRGREGEVFVKMPKRKYAYIKAVGWCSEREAGVVRRGTGERDGRRLNIEWTWSNLMVESRRHGGWFGEFKKEIHDPAKLCRRTIATRYMPLAT